MADLKVIDSTASRARSFYQETPPTAATNDRPAFLVHTETLPSNFKGRIYSKWVQINTLPIFRTISTKSEPLEGIHYINLQVHQSFHVPLSNDFIFGQFYCTDESASWDEVDLPKLQGTVDEAIAAGLTGKIVLIGDSTQIFEQNGVLDFGPFVFRSARGAVQIIQENSVFQVINMQLQPLSTARDSIVTERFMSTTSSALIPQNRDTIIVDGVGDILFPDHPVDQFRVDLDDRKYRRLGPGRNRIVPASGATIGLGQSAIAIDHLTPLTWDEDDRGSFSRYIYEAASNNWAAFLTREVAGTSLTQAARPLISTTNADEIAQPYDLFYLGGNTTIYIYHLVAERQFIDIEWAVNSAWNARVVCPVGFTFGGVFEDLEIATALTSVTRLQITLGANNTFLIN